MDLLESLDMRLCVVFAASGGQINTSGNLSGTSTAPYGGPWQTGHKGLGMMCVCVASSWNVVMVM